MSYCVFPSDLKKDQQCSACGYKLRRDYEIAVYRECDAYKSVNRGWGDLLAIALAKGYVVPFVKITPASYRRWKVRCGLADACSCGERKEQINGFGRWVKKRREKLRRWGRWLRSWR